MEHDVIIQQPAALDGEADLILLFHGVGSNEEDMRPLGSFIAERRPAAWVVSVRSPHRSDFGSGWQWFSVEGVTEGNRPDRVARAMTEFQAAAAGWQRHTRVSPSRTTLVGFSQGAIMALEATQLPDRVLASHVVAIAGRFAQRPVRRPADTTVHVMHGDVDRVMPVHLAVEATQRLQELGAASTLDVFPGLGHGIDGRVAARIAERLQGGAPEVMS